MKQTYIIIKCKFNVFLEPQIVVVPFNVYSFSILRSLQILVVKCPSLTVSDLVKTSPDGCLTSQMNFNSNCSFSCPQGYQLQGPSYKQCGAGGQWSDNAKNVSCIGKFANNYLVLSHLKFF